MPDLDWDKLRESPSLFVEKVCGTEPFWYQKKFMDHESNKKVLCCGRQVGKSRTASWLALHKALTTPNADVIITADAMRQALELFNNITTEISNSPIPEESWGISRQTNTIMEFDNGSRILSLPTGRDGSKIRTYTADMLIVDEAAFIEEKVFIDALEPMTLTTDGDIILTSTPLGKTGFLYDKYTHPEWFELTVPSSANPLVSDEKFESMKSSRTEREIKQELLGQFVSSEDSFFPPELVKSCTADNIDAETDKIFLAADVSGTGSDETLLVSIDNNGNVFNVEAFNPDSQPVTKAANRIAALDEMRDYNKIIIDQTGLGQGPVEMVEAQVDNTKIESVKLKLRNKQELYQNLKLEMEQGNIRVPAAKKKYVNQMIGLGYKTTSAGNLKIHANSEARDDFPDALALGVSLMDGGVTGASGVKNRTSSAGTLGSIQNRGGGSRRSTGSSRYRF